MRRCMMIGLALAALALPLTGAAAQDRDIEENEEMQTATGTFDVNLTPAGDGEAVGRMTLAKTFHGDLDGTSAGTMLAVRSGVEGSAGYVAIEKFEGALAGRSGSFFLQHSGTMDRGAPSLSINVVPDSGTGALEGLSGNMTIDIAADGTHSYTFEYSLP